LNNITDINHLKSKENGSQVYIIEIFVEFGILLKDWKETMPRAWMKPLPKIFFLIGTALTLAGCNTISGTVGGVGKDISAIGNTLTRVSGTNKCRSARCGSVSRDCGSRGCRSSRRVVSDCGSRHCGGSSFRSQRREFVSTRERYAFRDRYSSRRSSSCCF